MFQVGRFSTPFKRVYYDNKYRPVAVLVLKHGGTTERDKNGRQPPVGTVLEEAGAPGHGSLNNLIAEGKEEIARAGRSVAAGNLCHQRGFSNGQRSGLRGAVASGELRAGSWFLKRFVVKMGKGGGAIRSMWIFGGGRVRVGGAGGPQNRGSGRER
jgi:hypothetical protein